MNLLRIHSLYSEYGLKKLPLWSRQQNRLSREAADSTDQHRSATRHPSLAASSQNITSQLSQAPIQGQSNDGLGVWFALLLVLALTILSTTSFTTASANTGVTALANTALPAGFPTHDFHAIVGGEPVQLQNMPYVVALYRIFNGELSAYTCSASLVGSRHVVTAAHCVVDVVSERTLKPSELQVRVGVTQLNSTRGAPINVSKVMPHPEFNLQGFANDIALLELEEDVDSEPVKLPILNNADGLFPQTGENASVAGWGDTFEGGGRDGLLRHVDLPVVSHLRCLPLFPDTLNLQTKFCAGGLREGAKDACKGDSGGPLVVERDGEAVLAGVVSSGRGCARAGVSAVFTRVSHFSQWLSTASNDKLQPETYAAAETDYPESANADTLDENNSLSDALYKGEIKMFNAEAGQTIRLTTLEGDADLYVYDDDGLDAGQPICVSNVTTPVDECRLEDSLSDLLVVVFGFDDSSFQIESNRISTVASGGSGGGVIGAGDGIALGLLMLVTMLRRYVSHGKVAR